jgi:hypothetical protein
MDFAGQSNPRSDHHSTEPAVLAAEIEQLPDRAGFLKIASQPAWMRVQFPVYDLPKVAEPFRPIERQSEADTTPRTVA